MIGTPGGTPDRPALFFADAGEFGAWLAVHHATAPDLWMGLYKKHIADPGLRWADAVVEALCWGWIDSRVERLDADAIRQRWTPRRPGGNWSAVNLATATRLIDEGRMQPPGLAAFRNRKVANDAPYSYEKPTGELPGAYAAQLAANPAASAFWAATTPSYRRICIGWVLGAKQEATRDRRMAQLVDDSANGRLIPSQRYGVQPAWVEGAAQAASSAGTPDVSS